MARISDTPRTRRLLALGALVLLLGGAVVGCAGDDDREAEETDASTDTTPLPPSRVDVRLTLVATSTTRDAYERLAPLFSRTEAGEGVLVERSFGSTFDQTQAVAFGLPADVFAPASEIDLLGLVEAEQVPRTWRDDEFGGLITRSVVAFVVRRGNPQGIRGWADLTKPGLRIVMADPDTSGTARWVSLAAYGAQLQQGRTKAQARAFLKELLRNVDLGGGSGREAFVAFARGDADVLLTSESQALSEQKKGSVLEHVVPDQTILIESPITVTTAAPREARAFVDFLRSAEAQRILAEEGYRPVRESAAAGFDFPTPPTLFRLADIGPPRDVFSEYFEPTFGLVPMLLRELGKVKE